jgi:hypothetical protein
MENIKEVIMLAAIIFPWAVLLIIGIIGFVILVYKEEGTISPTRLLMIYRKQLVSMLKGKKDADPS